MTRPSPVIVPARQPSINLASTSGGSPPVEPGGMPDLSANPLATLPAEIMLQVLSWVLETRDAEDTLNALARTSRQLADLVKDCRTSAAYKRFKYQQQTLPWTIDYIHSLHTRWFAQDPGSEDALRRLLFSRPGTAEALRIHLGATVLRACLEGDGLQGFKQLAFSSLSLTLNPGSRETRVARMIAEALPPDTCITVVVRNDQQQRAGQVAELVWQVASTGRPTGLIFRRGDDLVNGVWGDKNDKNALDDLFCIASGPGKINHIRFNKLNKPDDLLRALAYRCDAFEFLRLVVIECSQAPGERVIAFLAEELAARHDRGKSRLTVALHCEAWPNGDPEPEAIKAKREKYEEAGLFFGRIRTGRRGDDPAEVHAFEARLSSSVTEGSQPIWRN